MPNEVATIRAKMKLTPKAFGAIFGVHRTTIMRWERDEKPHPPEAMLRWMRQELEQRCPKKGDSKTARAGRAA